MQGKIVSIVEHFGFIKDGADSYYFNKRSMGEGQLYGSLQVGDFVNFDKTATPRGMAANNVVKQVVHLCEVPAERLLITSKDHAEVLAGKTYELKSITGFYDRSTSEAKNSLIEALKKLGVNCITNLEMHELQMREGNYHYKLRSFSCYAGIYLESVPVPDGYDFAAQAESNKQLIASKAKAVEELEAQYAKRRSSQVSNTLFWIILVFVKIPITFILVLGTLMGLRGGRRRW